MFLAKTCQFFHSNLIKISLEIMLSDFENKKKPFLALKKGVNESPKLAFFQRG